MYKNTLENIKDQKTADAFATSWNNLPEGSVYSYDQFAEWLLPLTQADVVGRNVLELGCGNGSLLFHMASWQPARLVGVDLGDSVLSAESNMSKARVSCEINKADLVAYRGEPMDVVYCIGVLHHLKYPQGGFESMLENTKSGGQFHGWVYAHEGNFIIRYIVDPLRKISSKLPWWFTKYGVATVSVLPYFVYAKIITSFPKNKIISWLPLYEYSFWISKREFSFFRHVAFDQLVTPQTVYIKKQTIESWLKDPRVEQGSGYIIFRNGNSWKFGGIKK
jgi:SAM-dependent methyltransferase